MNRQINSEYFGDVSFSRLHKARKHMCSSAAPRLIAQRRTQRDRLGASPHASSTEEARITYTWQTALRLVFDMLVSS